MSETNENTTYIKLNELNNLLTEVDSFTDNVFVGIDNLKESAPSIVKNYIDNQCLKASAVINEKLDEKKQQAITTFKSNYSTQIASVKMIAPALALLELVEDLNIDNVVTCVKSIIDVVAGPYIQPYQKYLDFIQQTIKMVDLINDIKQKVTSLQSKVSDPTQLIPDAIYFEQLLEKIGILDPKEIMSKFKINLSLDISDFLDNSITKTGTNNTIIKDVINQGLISDTDITNAGYTKDTLTLEQTSSILNLKLSGYNSILNGSTGTTDTATA